MQIYHWQVLVLMCNLYPAALVVYSAVIPAALFAATGFYIHILRIQIVLQNSHTVSGKINYILGTAFEYQGHIQLNGRILAFSNSNPLNIVISVK